jgi:hypothetical protein
MFSLTTSLWSALGVSRDSLTLFWTKWAGIAVALAPMATDLTKPPYELPSWLIRAIQITALLVSVSSAQHRTSGLPGEK